MAQDINTSLLLRLSQTKVSSVPSRLLEKPGWIPPTSPPGAVSTGESRCIVQSQTQADDLVLGKSAVNLVYRLSLSVSVAKVCRIGDLPIRFDTDCVRSDVGIHGSSHLGTHDPDTGSLFVC